MAKKVAEQWVEMLVGAGIKRVQAVTTDSLNGERCSNALLVDTTDRLHPC